VLQKFILRPDVKHLYRICSLSLLFLPAAAASAQAPELSADAPIAYSQDTGMLIATGNAVYTDEDTTVEADEIRYNRESNLIEGSGNVRVTRKGVRLLAESVNYDAGAKTFSAVNFRAGYPPLFIEGKSFAGSLEAIDFTEVGLYFREPAPGSAKVSVGSAYYVADEFLRAEEVRMGSIGHFRLPLPGFTYEFGTPAIEVDTSAGYEDNLGAYLQTSFLYPFYQSLSLGANLDLYSKRGVLIGPALKYQRPDGSVSAYLSSGWIHDNSSGERGEDILGVPIAPDRGFVDFGLQLKDEGALQFQARGTLLSDSEVLRDFREDAYFDLYHPDTFADFTWQQSSFLLNVFARAQVNDYYQMVERLPEVRAEWLPTEIADTGLYLQASAMATRYRMQQLVPSTGSIFFPPNPLGIPSIPPVGGSLPGDLVDSEFFERLDGAATLTRPFHGPAGIDLVLRGGGRWTYYNSDKPLADGSNSDERLMGELGFDLSQTLARTYSVDLPKLDIRKLRHQSRTILKYRWHPGAEDAPNAPAFDVYPYHARPVNLDLADLWHVDGLRELSVARFGWEHQVHVAGKDSPFREFLNLSFYQDLILDEDPGEDQWDAFYAQMEFTPVSWFRLQYGQKFRTEGFRNEAAFVRATVSSSDLWALSLQAEYLKNAIEQYRADAWYRLTENLGLFGNWQYDAFLKTWTHQRYGISRRFANTWQLELYVTLTDADQRQGDVGVGIRVKWLSF
jgi:LPS-assembly protein